MIRTLNLLFPYRDDKTTAFLKSACLHLHVAGASDAKQAATTTEFRYWKSEISRLVRLWEAPLETMDQTLRDTRNFGHLIMIWVAIFSIFFLTILFGILATVYSVKQYLLAVKSHKLALAPACLENPTWPGFCA